MKNDISEVDYTIEDNGAAVVFKVDGKARFRMAAAALSALMDRERMAKEIEKKREADHYFDIRHLTPKEYCFASRMMRKELRRECVPRMMGITERQFGLLLIRGGDEAWFQTETYKKALEAAKAEDYVLRRKPRDLVREGWEALGKKFDEESYYFVSVSAVAKKVLAGESPDAIAKKFDLDERDFTRWYSANERYFGFV